MKSHSLSKKKPIIIILITLAGLVLFYLTAGMIFIKIMYDKQFTRAEVPLYSGYLKYEDVNGYDRSPVEFESSENTLRGFLYGGKSQKGLVVIAHGLGGGAERYLAETLYFVDKGWKVLAFDCTGSYSSEGKSTMGLPQSTLDLDAALKYIESNDELANLPVMLYGHSWGAYAVTAILNYDHDISAVVSLAGFNSPMELSMEQVSSIMGSMSNLVYPHLWLYQHLLFGEASSQTAVEGINRSEIPVMIIHGNEDEAIYYNSTSIISHQDEITNPNAEFFTSQNANQNRHNTLTRTYAAIDYIDDLNEKYKDLYDQYAGEIPDEVKVKYYSGIDHFLVSELDENFMGMINQFFENSLEE